VQRAGRMKEGFGAFAMTVNAAIASPWTLAVALALVGAHVPFGPALGFPPGRSSSASSITLSTFVLVFLIEHEGYRDNAATR
jgi:low affinity Fe/Cu permease